jgi:16S rRNA (uracil1498-N3)-methyltransferase
VNIVCFRPEDIFLPNRARVHGRRARHILEVLKAHPGQSLDVGILGGGVGQGIVTEVASEHVDFEFSIDREPPSKSRVDLLLAVPRPKVLARILGAATAQGVERIFLVRTWRVEKSYFSAQVLDPRAVEEHLIAGLEIAGDTRLPTVEVFPLFRPFVEDVLPIRADGARGIVFSPDAVGPIVPSDLDGKRTMIAIGPEGGFIPFEVEALERAGFLRRSLGDRILRVETATAAAFGEIAAFRRLTS